MAAPSRAGATGPDIALQPSSVDETLGMIYDFSGFTSGVFYVVPTGTVTSGVVTIEESYAANYTGAWSTISASAAIGTGVQQALHLNVSANAYKFVRCRISTAIGGGGTVSVYFFRN